MKFIWTCLILLLLTGSNPEARIRSAEAGIRHSPVEIAIAFDSQGNELARFAGDAGRVPIPDAILDSLQGDILTHNHPSYNTTFSADDLGVAWRLNLAEVRVVSIDARGRPTLCVMRRGKRGWPPMAALHWGFSGTLTEASNAYDAVWRRLAALTGLVYRCDVLEGNA